MDSLPDRVDDAAHPIGLDPPRRAGRRLAEGDLTVGDLAEPLTMTLAAVSKHIKVLERAGLVRQTIAGRHHMCRLEATPLAPASAWLRFYERHWEERLDALENFFRTDPNLGKEDQ